MKTPAILLRGAPGSGKTTYAETHYPDHLLVEADQFFMINGVYRFNPKFLRDAHNYSIARFMLAIDEHIPVVVANTFIRRWEIEPYLNLCRNARIIRCTGNFTSVHGVPTKKIAEMRENIEPIKDEFFFDPNTARKEA